MKATAHSQCAFVLSLVTSFTCSLGHRDEVTKMSLTYLWGVWGESGMPTRFTITQTVPSIYLCTCLN